MTFNPVIYNINIRIKFLYNTGFSRRRVSELKFKLVYFPIFLITFVAIAPAHAYIDPNTGGFFFQTVAPFVYGLLGVIVVFWKRITGYVAGLFGRNKTQDDSDKK